MPEDHQKPPTTIREVGIHVGYLRDDITDIKITLKELAEGAVTRNEFDALSEKVKTNEEKMVTKNEFRLVTSVITFILGTAVVIIGLIDRIKG